MKKTQDKKINSFHVRIYDDELLTELYALAELKEFSSMNELMNTALSIGIEKMYLDRGKRKSFAESKSQPTTPTANFDEMLKKLKGAELTLDDIFVMMNVMEMLLTTLYNNEVMKIKGEPVGIELLESGYMAQLPENIQQVKDKLIRRLSKKEK